MMQSLTNVLFEDITVGDTASVSRTLSMTDAAINIAPTLEEKADIVRTRLTSTAVMRLLVEAGRRWAVGRDPFLGLQKLCMSLRPPIAN